SEIRGIRCVALVVVECQNGAVRPYELISSRRRRADGASVEKLGRRAAGNRHRVNQGLGGGGYVFKIEVGCVSRHTGTHLSGVHQSCGSTGGSVDAVQRDDGRITPNGSEGDVQVKYSVAVRRGVFEDRRRQ